jgi:hypothetical protein
LILSFDKSILHKCAHYYAINYYVRKVWRYQRGVIRICIYIEEEQTTQWPKEKVQKDKQQSTKHTHKTCVMNSVLVRKGIYE